MQCSTLVRIMKQDRHPIDFDTAGSGEMAVLALVLGLEGPLLTTIMLKQGASLVMALGVLLLPVGIILPLVWCCGGLGPAVGCSSHCKKTPKCGPCSLWWGSTTAFVWPPIDTGCTPPSTVPSAGCRGSPSLFLGQRSRGKNKGPSGSSPTLEKPWLRGDR